MKNLSFIFSLIAILFMASCSEKEHAPIPGNDEKPLIMVFSGINVPANSQNVSSTAQSKELADILSKLNKDKVPYVYSGRIKYEYNTLYETISYDTHIKIEGLKEDESLSNMTVKLIDGQSVITTLNCGKIDAIQDGDPVIYMSNDCISFMTWVLNTLVSKKSITLEILFNGGPKDVNDLKVTVHSTAVFSW